MRSQMITSMFVIELLESGADIDRINSISRETPLQYAAQQRCTDVLRVLLQRGASADHCDENGFDLHIACSYPTRVPIKIIPSMDLYSLVSEHLVLDFSHTWYKGSTLLHTAASHRLDGFEIIALMSHVPNIDAKDDNGDTALKRAVKSGNWSAALALLENGADPWSDQFSVEEMLLKSIQRKATTKDPVIPVYQTVADYEADCEEVVAYLLEHGQPDIDMVWHMPAEADVSEYYFTMREYAEAYGRGIEASFLTLLWDFGRPDHYTEKDERRLIALIDEGYAPQGYVVADVDDGFEDDGTNTSEWETTDDDEDYDSDSNNDHDDNHEDDASSVQEKRSNEGEEEQFWDAEGGL
jgi:hypothetical protein